MSSDVDRQDRAEPDPSALQQALRASEARFRNIIEKNADGVIVAQKDGVILYVNPALENLLCRPSGELQGTDFGIPIVPGERTEVDIPCGDRILVAEMRVVETEWDGSPAYLATLRDITDRKRLEEELRERVEALAADDHRKNEFLAMLAHELRNPLAPIRNAVQILRAGGDAQLLDRMRDMIGQQVDHIARLVDDLLDVSRITRGKIPLRKDLVDLAAIVGKATAALRPTIEAQGLSFVVHLPEESVLLEADPTRLEQVTTNLLNNAAKFTNPGGTIRVEVEKTGQEGLLRVRDTGIGMEPEVLSHIFDLFAQADQSLDRSQGGLGIGLTLSKRLVEMHDGRLEGSSDGLGHGSEFRIFLPLAENTVASPATPSSCDGRSKKDSPSRKTHSLRVLVVDDNVQSTESLAVLLKIWGHEARVAFDGPEAIRIALEIRPQVILLDIGLPKMDGYQVARRLREHPELLEARIVAMTGYGQENDRRLSQEAGFDQHMVKPVDLDALETMLVKISSSHRLDGANDGDGQVKSEHEPQHGGKADAKGVRHG